MAGLTFGGKPAASVAVRSPHLPLLGRAIAAERETKRAQRIAREDGYIQAARWRGRQVAWHMARSRALHPIKSRLNGWIEHNPDHPDLRRMTERYWTVTHSIRAHRRQLDDAVAKFDDLVKKKPAKQQEALTSAYYAALSGPPPARKPPAVMEVER